MYPPIYILILTADASDEDIIVSTTLFNTNTCKRMPFAGILSEHVAYISAACPTALNTAAVVGIVVALIVVMATCYSCGFLTGLLIKRKRKQAPSTSGDLSAPTYEQVLPPAKVAIPLQENEAYGHLSN